MLLFTVRWFIRIIKIIKEGKGYASQNTKKNNIDPNVSQDRMKIKIPK